MTDKPAIDARIARARSRIASNIGELQQRMSRAKEIVSPSTYLTSPWLTVGAGIAFGLLIGRRRAPLQLTAGATAAASPSLVGTAVRTAAIALARLAIERVVANLADPGDDDDE